MSFFKYNNNLTFRVLETQFKSGLIAALVFWLLWIKYKQVKAHHLFYFRFSIFFKLIFKAMKLFQILTEVMIMIKALLYLEHSFIIKTIMTLSLWF